MLLDFLVIWESLPKLAFASVLTLKLTGCILLLGLVIALPVGLGINSNQKPLRSVSEGYILIFRGTPALVQLFIVYFGLGQFEFIRESFAWVFLRDAFWCAVIALGMNSGAYTGRMFGGALKAVPQGYIEAAQSMGMSNFSIFVTIKAPLAIRMVLPAYGNEIILTLKATALASAITLQELMGEARAIASDTFAPYEAFIAAGIMYLAMTTIVGRGITMAEKRLETSHQATGIPRTEQMDTAK